MSSEREKIAFLKDLFATSASHVACGVGDDAAVLSTSGEAVVASVDVAVEGTHFQRAWLSWDELGYRSTMAAMSDLAAMGARPLGLLSSLVLPNDLPECAWSEIAQGQLRACTDLSTVVVGGNLAAGTELSITSTVLGVTSRPLMRGGAKPGDGLWAAGPLGWAHLELLCLQRGRGNHAPVAEGSAPKWVEQALTAWSCPVAQIAIGQRLVGKANAAIDVSDGLALDVARLAVDSDVVVELQASGLATPRLMAAATALNTTAKDAVLFGGEDYALVVAGPDTLGDIVGMRRIGRCRAPRSETEARVYWSNGANGEAITVSGFDHFTKPPLSESP